MRNYRNIHYLVAWSILLLSNCSPKNPVKTADKGSEWISISNGLTSLTVQTIAADPSAPSTMYVGTLEGAFKTADGGKAWSRLTNGLTSQDIKTIKVHPQENNWVFCGTWGKGLFRSSDHGQSWQSAWPAGPDPRIFSIHIAGGNQNILWAATENGLYKSADKGLNWSRSFHYASVLAIASAPNDPNVAFIGVRYKGVFKSTDNGADWAPANQGIYNSGNEYASANSFALSPVNANQVYMSTGWVDLYESIDGGSAWQQIAPQLSQLHVVAVAVDNKEPQQLWAATQSSGVYRSKDGGDTWTACNEGLDTLEMKSICLVGGNQTIVYVGTIGKGIYKYVAVD